MENFKSKNRKRAKSFTFKVYNDYVTISDGDFGIVLPKSYTIASAIKVFNDAKSAQDLFFNQFKTK